MQGERRGRERLGGHGREEGKEGRWSLRKEVVGRGKGRHKEDRRDEEAGIG